MAIRWNLEPDGTDHIAKHSLTRAEVEEVILSPRECHAGRHNTDVALGTTSLGRHIKVIFVPDRVGPGLFIVTAYDLTGSQLAGYKTRNNIS